MWHKLTGSHPFPNENETSVKWGFSPLMFTAALFTSIQIGNQQKFPEIGPSRVFLTKWVNPVIMTHTMECHELIQAILNYTVKSCLR